MLRNNIIEESNSPWCSPVMIIKQTSSDGKAKFRFLADMRDVNEITKKDSFPLPRIDQAIDALGRDRGIFQLSTCQEVTYMFF